MGQPQLQWEVSVQLIQLQQDPQATSYFSRIVLGKKPVAT